LGFDSNQTVELSTGLLWQKARALRLYVEQVVASLRDRVACSVRAFPWLRQKSNKGALPPADSWKAWKKEIRIFSRRAWKVFRRRIPNTWAMGSHLFASPKGRTGPVAQAASATLQPQFPGIHDQKGPARFSFTLLGASATSAAGRVGMPRMIRDVASYASALFRAPRRARHHAAATGAHGEDFASPRASSARRFLWPRVLHKKRNRHRDFGINF